MEPSGKLVTADALHIHGAHVVYLNKHKNSDYLFTVKGNQRTLLAESTESLDDEVFSLSFRRSSNDGQHPVQRVEFGIGQTFKAIRRRKRSVPSGNLRLAHDLSGSCFGELAQMLRAASELPASPGRHEKVLDGTDVKEKRCESLVLFTTHRPAYVQTSTRTLRRKIDPPATPEPVR